MDNSKAKKIKKRFNGGFAIYYGMGSALTAIGTVVTLISRLYQIWSGKAELNWAVIILLLVFASISGFVAYLLLRVGYEEIENQKIT
jgi:phage shock protein PspC (stress-responsive transcriptional regulator)